jgi:membrane-bound metal-dependent hydrolase YbcI (DUF457 family)
MLLLGHIGITLGIIYVLAWLIYAKNMKALSDPSSKLPVDFRIVIISAMIPDIVDKIVGMVILKEEISNGRIFTHTIIITGIIGASIFNLVQIKYKKIIIMLYILPTFIHLFLDRLWEDFHTLFWPIFGLGYNRLDVDFGDYLGILMSDWFALTGELLGALIIVIFFVGFKLYKGKNFKDFLKRGRFGG